MNNQRQKGWEVKEKAQLVTHGWPLPGWCDDLFWRACGDRGPKLLLTSSESLLHVVNVSNERFLCPCGLAAWVKGKWDLRDFSAPFRWLGNVCGLLGRAVSKSREGGMSSPSWMEIHVRKGMLWDKSVTICGYVILPLCGSSSFRTLR